MNNGDVKQGDAEVRVKLGVRMEKEGFSQMMRSVNSGRAYNDGLRVYVSGAERVYKGPVIYETERHLLQQVGKCTAILHDRELVRGQLSDNPRAQYEIAYAQSEATLEVIPFQRTNQEVMQRQLLAVLKDLPKKEIEKATQYINKAFELLAQKSKEPTQQQAPERAPEPQR